MGIFISQRFFRSLAAGLILTAASAAAVQAVEGDVWLHTDAVNNKLAVGIVDEAATTYTPDVHVFTSILIPDTLPFSAFDFSGEEPGFRSAAGDLPASQPISLAISSLSAWNGAGLDPVAVVDFGFDLSGGFSTEASGAFHEHPLRGLTDLTPGPPTVPDGVYVATVRATVPGLSSSDLIHLVMLKDDLITDEDDAEELLGLLEDFENGGPAPVFGAKNFAFFNEAAEFVNASVPEPSSVLLAGGAALSFVAARRRC